MAKVTIENPNLGGIADSKYLGGANSLAEMVGLDIHSEVGVIKVNQALTENSGGLVTEFVKAAVSCSDGNSYHFSSTTGKVWKRTSAGVWSLATTLTPAAGSAGVTGVSEVQGYLYYSMQNRLGRVAVPSGSDVDWGTRSDNFATFTNGDADFHPHKIVNGVLYIGDANLVAQVDAGTFSASALDIKSPLRIKALGKINTDLLIGTFVADNVNRTELLRWNTWSVSFTVADDIPEVGINAFLDTDNAVLVSAGTKGRIYEYDGAKLQPYGRIQGVFTNGTTNKITVHPNSSFNFDGIPLFGVSQVSGNAAKYGVYSIARYSINYPRVTNVEYLASTGNETNMEYGAIIGIGDQFLVAWKDNDAGTFGVDILDLTTKFSGAYLTTRVMQVDRRLKTTYGLAYAAYRLMPANCDIQIWKLVNHAAESQMTTKNDADRLLVETDDNIEDAVTVQMRYKFITDGNNAPEMEKGEVDIPT